MERLLLCVMRAHVLLQTFQYVTRSAAAAVKSSRELIKTPPSLRLISSLAIRRSTINMHKSRPTQFFNKRPPQKRKSAIAKECIDCEGLPVFTLRSQYPSRDSTKYPKINPNISPNIRCDRRRLCKTPSLANNCHTCNRTKRLEDSARFECQFARPD